MTSNREKLKQLLSHFSGTSKVLVIINADPDAIASAMAVKRILWRRVSEVVITYFNRITRPDNLAMIEYTEAGIIPMANVDKSLFDKFVVVDSQPDHNENFSGIEFNAIIDHHPLSCTSAGFVDIRPDYGACSTMFTEYLRSLKVKPSAKLASALMLGIKTDTANFTRHASSRDLRAFQFLYKYADMNIVTKVERSHMTESELDFLGNAIRNRISRDNRAFYHAGIMSKPDALVVAADFFLSIAGVNWSVVSGVVDKKLIVILRNDGLRKGAGKTAQEAFGKFGSAGGHKTMARAELDISLIRKEVNRVSQKALTQWVVDRITQTAGKKIE
ncbi:DHH family phosphoesterase [uncultured Desulfobacter sp.]|uniref:DHH family phosphoesterase n=1 Tax=uncultured Desulfobacter sp. TaxID=240139 RepID=UPI002AAAEFBB|nr:DHH family phosphoesterase [uncultured Desulfobacter sp.]